MMSTWSSRASISYKSSISLTHTKRINPTYLSNLVLRGIVVFDESGGCPDLGRLGYTNYFEHAKQEEGKKMTNPRRTA
jgi:hypothetical protein